MEREYIFSGQRPDEKVLEVVKSHPLVLFYPGLKSFFFLMLGGGVLIFHPERLPVSIIALICFSIALAIISQALYCFTQNIAILTDQRIICVKQQGFLKRNISELEIVNIQDISSSTNGLIRTIFKYGNLTIRSAGANRGAEIVVHDIPDPYDVQKSIAFIKQSK